MASAQKKSKWWRKDSSFFPADIAGSRRSQLPSLDQAFSSATGSNASITRSGGEDHNDFGAVAKLGFQGEGPAVEFNEAFYDRQTQAGAFLGVFLRERAAAERGHDNWDLVFRNSGTAVAHSHILTAARGPADPDLDRSALRRELDRVR